MTYSTSLAQSLTWTGIALCITQSAIFSGLNLAIFSVLFIASFFWRHTLQIPPEMFGVQLPITRENRRWPPPSTLQSSGELSR
jgi:hypothetical protein